MIAYRLPLENTLLLGSFLALTLDSNSWNIPICWLHHRRKLYIFSKRDVYPSQQNKAEWWERGRRCADKIWISSLFQTGFVWMLNLKETKALFCDCQNFWSVVHPPSLMNIASWYLDRRTSTLWLKKEQVNVLNVLSREIQDEDVLHVKGPKSCGKLYLGRIITQFHQVIISSSSYDNLMKMLWDVLSEGRR